MNGFIELNYFIGGEPWLVNIVFITNVRLVTNKPIGGVSHRVVEVEVVGQQGYQTRSIMVTQSYDAVKALIVGDERQAGCSSNDKLRLALETLKRVQRNIGPTEPVQDELATVIAKLEEVKP